MNRHSMQLKKMNKQAGLSLLWTAVFSALLAILIIGGLYSMRYGRNPFFDAFDSLIGKAATSDAMKKSQAAVDEAKSAVSGKPVPPSRPDGTIRKCTINGQVTYSNTECGNSGRKIEVKETAQGMETAKPTPTPSKVPMNATDLAIERATK